MSGSLIWRALAVSTQLAALIVAVGCGSDSVRTPTRETPQAPPAAAAPDPAPNPVPSPTPGTNGVVSGTVTINGEARPIAWVELLIGDWPWAFQATVPNGSWEWNRVPVGNYILAIKTPPGLTCDATRKAVMVATAQRSVVNFACVGDVAGSIQGFATNEFGTAGSVRLKLTGPVNREIMSNRDGFFVFEDLPDGDYRIDFCADPARVTVRKGVTAYTTVDCS